MLLLSDKTEDEESSEHFVVLNSLARSARNLLPDMT